MCGSPVLSRSGVVRGQHGLRWLRIGSGDAARGFPTKRVLTGRWHRPVPRSGGKTCLPQVTSRRSCAEQRPRRAGPLTAGGGRRRVAPAVRRRERRAKSGRLRGVSARDAGGEGGTGGIARSQRPRRESTASQCPPSCLLPTLLLTDVLGSWIRTAQRRLTEVVMRISRTPTRGAAPVRQRARGRTARRSTIPPRLHETPAATPRTRAVHSPAGA